MKVIFVASGNKKFGVSSFVAEQAKSLIDAGVNVVTFPVTGHGWKGYLANLFRLRKVVRREHPDLIHAHYTTCGLLASLASRKPVVVSVLGSFPNPSAFKLKWVRFFVSHIWVQTITKSRRTASQLGISGIEVIPNGVNMEQFKPYPYEEARKAVGFDSAHKYVIFVSNPSRQEKNYQLAEKAVEKLNDPSVCLVPVFDKPHDEVVRYMSAADVLVLTSVSEGSPNVIKEAMSCNCPIVSTDVGDVRERLDGLDGCFVAEGNPMLTHNDDLLIDFTHKLSLAIVYCSRTDGRKRIQEDGLSNIQIARKIIDVYNSAVK